MAGETRTGSTVESEISRADVSVIIAVRNGLPYVAEAVASALAQDDFADPCALREVIVVDDASTDGTLAALEEIADPRLVLIRNPGRGVSAARNAGIAASHAPWLLFLDADDRLAPGALSSLLAAARTGAIGIYGDYERIDGTGRTLGRRRIVHRHRVKPSGNVLGTMLSGNFLINGGVMICAREACLSANGFDTKLALCEDWHFWCRLAALGPLVYLPRHVMDYRVHQTSVMMHKQRRFPDFAPALDTIFSDPLVVSGLANEQLQRLRRRGAVSLMTYCAQQAIRSRAIGDARALTLAAISHHPRRAPWVVARVAGAAAGF